MQSININGIGEVPVIGQVKSKKLGRMVPLVDIKLMSDEEWQRGAVQNAVDNYKRRFGEDPESEEEAVEWQRASLKAIMLKAVEEAKNDNNITRR